MLKYAQEKNDELHYPEPVSLYPHPDTLKTVQNCTCKAFTWTSTAIP